MRYKKAEYLPPLPSLDSLRAVIPTGNYLQNTSNIASVVPCVFAPEARGTEAFIYADMHMDFAQAGYIPKNFRYRADDLFFEKLDVTSLDFCLGERDVMKSTDAPPPPALWDEILKSLTIRRQRAP